jgi:hypothetical protein
MIGLKGRGFPLRAAVLSFIADIGTGRNRAFQALSASSL